MSIMTPERYRRKISIDFEGVVPITEQAHKDEVSIHNIMRRYKATGVLTHVNQYRGQYMDMAQAPEYQEAQNIIADAKSMFETVPADIRQDMHNDPMEFVEFMQNPGNREKIEDYGLDTSHLPPEVAEQPVVPTPAPTPTTTPVTPPEATQEL